MAGLVLIPFSVPGFVAGKLTPGSVATDRLFPYDDACTTAALVGVAAMAITTMAALALARRRSQGVHRRVDARTPRA
ncbi:hypothetical protein [Streptomyces sp. NPDC002666]